MRVGINQPPDLGSGPVQGKLPALLFEFVLFEHIQLFGLFLSGVFILF
jgi:hypothetical protein